MIQEAEIIWVDRLGFDVRAILGREMKILRFSFNTRVCGKNYMLVYFSFYHFCMSSQELLLEIPPQNKIETVIVMFAFCYTDLRYFDFESGNKWKGSWKENHADAFHSKLCQVLANCLWWYKKILVLYFYINFVIFFVFDPLKDDFTKWILFLSVFFNINLNKSSFCWYFLTSLNLSSMRLGMIQTKNKRNHLIWYLRIGLFSSFQLAWPLQSTTVIMFLSICLVAQCSVSCFHRRLLHFPLARLGTCGILKE